jgi:hypothetical protein
MVRTLTAVVPLWLLPWIAPAAALSARSPEQDVRSVVSAAYRALARSDAGELAALFTADAELRIGIRLAATGPNAIAEALRGPVWSEVSPPWLENVSIRMPSPDTAMVDAQQIRFGSIVGKQSLPVLILLARGNAGWQVVSIRILPGGCAGAAFHLPFYIPAVP